MELLCEDVLLNYGLRDGLCLPMKRLMFSVRLSVGYQKERRMHDARVLMFHVSVLCPVDCANKGTGSEILSILGSGDRGHDI